MAVRLHVDWPEPEDQRPELQTVYQAYMVTDGLITEIHGHDDEESALAASQTEPFANAGRVGLVLDLDPSAVGSARGDAKAGTIRVG